MVDPYLIERGSRVRDALRQLEDAESGTLFVVDAERRLLGSLTDGDVRRWILGGGDLEGVVECVCETEPLVAAVEHDPVAMKREMLTRGIKCIPVVDVNGAVRDVLTWQHLFGNGVAAPARAPIRLPVVIMAGGAGTRLAPFTTVLPKALIPIGGKTVIELIVESFTAHGVDVFYLSLHYKSRIIKSYFEELEPTYSVRYVFEDEPLGTAGALSSLVGQVDTDLIVTNCDVIIRADFHELVTHHQLHENDITVVVSLRHYGIPYGVCEIESGGTLREIREKPEYSFLVNTGLYVLKPSVLETIPRGERFHFTDLITATRARGGRVGVFPISDKAWIDTGEWDEYRSAVAALMPDGRPALR